MNAQTLQARLIVASKSPALSGKQRRHAALLATEVMEDIIDRGGDFEIEELENYLDDLIPMPHEALEHITLIED